MNSNFFIDGFWKRVEQACAESGMTKKEIAERMGVERKTVYNKASRDGYHGNWHSGRLKKFCEVTGVSADWILGLSKVKELNRDV